MTGSGGGLLWQQRSGILRLYEELLASNEMPYSMKFVIGLGLK
jgi:hypothetical protein